MIYADDVVGLIKVLGIDKKEKKIQLGSDEEKQSILEDMYEF